MTIAEQIVKLKKNRDDYYRWYLDADEKLKAIEEAVSGTSKPTRTSRPRAARGSVKKALESFFEDRGDTIITAADIAKALGLPTHRAGVELANAGTAGRVLRVSLGRYYVPKGSGSGVPSSEASDSVVPMVELQHVQ